MPLFLLFYLSIGAIFQNEAPYLKEWVEFHKMLGVEHFYLYDNDSTDNPLEVLQPYIAEGLVDYIPWPTPERFDDLGKWNLLQTMAYNQLIAQTSGVSHWVAFLDTDEFLFPVEHNNLVDFLKEYDDVGGIGVNWVIYGTSHISKIPQGALLIETLVYRSCDPDLHIKSIVHPERVLGCINPHFFYYKKGYSQVNSDKVPFTGPFSPAPLLNKIRINHYWSRDEEYYRTQKIPRREKWGLEIDPQQLESANALYDPAIFRFISFAELEPVLPGVLLAQDTHT